MKTFQLKDLVMEEESKYDGLVFHFHDFYHSMEHRKQRDVKLAMVPHFLSIVFPFF